MPIKDFLIVGQGLAGSLLAWELGQNNQSILVIDNQSHSASKVAAGLINPITGMRLVKQDNIDEYLSTALSLYKNLASYFGQTFYTELPMLRILKNDLELSAARKRLNQDDYLPYLESINTKIESDYGVLEQKQTGTLDIPKLLKTLKEFFIGREEYRDVDFNESQLTVADTIDWNGERFRNVIFCQGAQLLTNDYFDWLPLKPVKGEILTVETQTEQPIANSIVNYGYWSVPKSNDQFLTGATFDRENVDHTLTDTAKSELLSAFNKHIATTGNVDVINHQAGIRPTTPDRSPMIGHHPKHTNMYVFNGFGTKGSLLIPFYRHILCDHLLHDKPIPIQVNISRYIDDYFTD